MIQLIGGDLYQWDVRRSVVFTPEGTDAEALHFAHQGDSKAVIMELVDSQARIPDYLLQSDKALCVYAVSAGVTFEKVILPVRKRERPENYVYEDDRRNYIYELIQAAKDAVDDANTVVAELRTARDSGEFDGPQGDPGSSGVYVLGEGETEADVPEGVDVLIDPNGEPLVIPQPLVVTITDDVASHTSAEIYAHVQAGGSAVLNETDNWGVTLNYLGGNEDYASFGAWLDEMRMVHATIWSDGAAEFAEPNYANNDDLANKINRPSTAKVGQTIVVKSVHTDGRPIAWEAADLPSDDHINSLIDAKLGVIENGSY